MRSFYARVEHKVVVGVDIVNLLAVTSLILFVKVQLSLGGFGNS